ncbi:MAG: glycosyltransferase family 39 protein [bacterium]|nr:glycosyltransferase family 39 protein [bacterium]
MLKKIHSKWIFILILILGSILRFINLEGRCFWCDELESYNRALQPASSMLANLIRNTPHIPLYYLLLHFWLNLGISDAFVRTLSSIFGVMTIIISYYFFKKLFDRKVALLSVFFLAVSPFHIMFSRMTREYSLVCLLSVCSMFSFWLVISTKSNRFYKWLIYGIVSILLVYTHYYCWFIIIAQGIFLLIYKRKKLRHWIGTNTIILCLFLPWIGLNILARLNGEWGSVLTIYTSSTFGYFIKAAYFFYSFTLGQTVYPFNLYMAVPLLTTFFIVFIYGVIYLLREHNQYKKIILFWLFIPFIIGIFLPLYAPRQLLVSLPAFCLILATGIVRMRYSWLKWIVGTVIILACAYSNYNYFTNRQYFDVDMITPWRAITDEITVNEQKDDVVLLGRLMEGFPHYYKGILPICRINPFDKPEQIKQYGGKHKRLWMLLHSERPRENFEEWMRENGEIILIKKYLYEENTLKGLRESFKNIHKYHEYKYKLYLFKLK